jgi:hypothetical protein
VSTEAEQVEPDSLAFDPADAPAMAELAIKLLCHPASHLANLEFGYWLEWMRILVPVMLPARRGELLGLIEARAAKLSQHGESYSHLLFGWLLEKVGLELALKAREGQGS